MLEELARVRPLSRKEAVLTALRESIIGGRLKPGERLDPDSIAEVLGCSRMPVRDAFKALEAEGLVTCYPSRHTEVSRLDARDVEQIFGIRLALEQLALRRAVERLTDGDLAAMRDCLVVMDGTQDTELWLSTNERFHAQINRASGWPRLVEQIEIQRRNIGRYVRVRLEDGRLSPQRQHWELYQACVARDADRACAILEGHLSQTSRMIADETGQIRHGTEDANNGL